MTNTTEARRLADELASDVAVLLREGLPQEAMRADAAQAAMRALADERDSLRAQVEALRADAERLDYIAGNARCDPTMGGQHVWWPTSFNHRLIGPTLRAAIDAARSQEAAG